MTMFWVGVIGGMWIGAPIGFVIAAILMAAKEADREAGLE